MKVIDAFCLLCWKKRVNNRKALKIKFNGIYSLCDDDGGGRGDDNGDDDGGDDDDDDDGYGGDVDDNGGDCDDDDGDG